MCNNGESVRCRLTAATAESSVSSMCLRSLVVAVLVTLCCPVHPVLGSVNRDVIRAFTDRFAQTSGEPFYELWHTDCHRRCRAQLVSHVTLACTFDPYKVNKRRLNKRAINATIEHIIKDTETTPVSPFLPRTTAASFLRRVSVGKSVAHRRTKRGIMNECCYSKSCSWEEYAEFCHTYNRRPAVRDTSCYP